MKILELPMPFVTPNIALPSFDAFGWPHGEAYEAQKKARTVRFSTRTTMRGLKFKRRYEALSMNEWRPLLHFSFHPYVLDMRDQYPVYDPRRFDRAVLHGERMRKTDLMTVDLVLTIALPPNYQLFYHGISFKDSRHILTDAEERRHVREKARLEERGWTWECLRGGQFSNLAFANHLTMYRSIRDTNVFDHYRSAQEFSKVVLNTSVRGTMDQVISRAARRFGVSDHDGHRFFSIAVVFGFLYPDHSKPLQVDAPLNLIRWEL